MANNKTLLGFDTVFAYTQNGNATFVNSNLDALLAYANDYEGTSLSGGGLLSRCSIDHSYLFNTTTTASVAVFPNIVRQDAQTINPIRLPQATENCLGVIISQADAFASYFYNSILLKTDSGFIRIGIVNFTASQPTNPFAPGQQATLSAVWSFLDIPKA